jgi:hypothetical protein
MPPQPPLPEASGQPTDAGHEVTYDAALQSLGYLYVTVTTTEIRTEFWPLGGPSTPYDPKSIPRSHLDFLGRVGLIDRGVADQSAQALYWVRSKSRGLSKAAAKPSTGCEEIALFGAGEDGGIAFWSFISDGKRSQGASADVTDLHPEAVGFEAQMPAGLARMSYWPDGQGGFFFVVESKNKKGWKRFLEHHYRTA